MAAAGQRWSGECFPLSFSVEVCDGVLGTDFSSETSELGNHALSGHSLRIQSTKTERPQRLIEMPDNAKAGGRLRHSNALVSANGGLARAPRDLKVH